MSHTPLFDRSISVLTFSHFTRTSLSTFSDSKSSTELLSFLEAFGEKPLADLAKRTKKDETLSKGLTCEESAYVLLLELFANGLGDISR